MKTIVTLILLFFRFSLIAAPKRMKINKVFEKNHCTCFIYRAVGMKQGLKACVVHANHALVLLLYPNGRL